MWLVLVICLNCSLHLFRIQRILLHARRCSEVFIDGFWRKDIWGICCCKEKWLTNWHISNTRTIICLNLFGRRMKFHQRHTIVNQQSKWSMNKIYWKSRWNEWSLWSIVIHIIMSIVIYIIMVNSCSYYLTTLPSSYWFLHLKL